MNLIGEDNQLNQLKQVYKFDVEQPGKVEYMRSWTFLISVQYCSSWQYSDPRCPSQGVKKTLIRCKGFTILLLDIRICDMHDDFIAKNKKQNW